MLVRTRFAPSPTGDMHVGNLRTALYEYLIAKSKNGSFVLRIEDTDRERLDEGTIDIIYKTLQQAGLKYDEGPDIGGPFGPYMQSQRKSDYLNLAKELIKKGEAYYCFCTKDRLEQLKEDSKFAGYDRHCRNLTNEEVNNLLALNTPFVIRQKMPVEGETTFEDAVFGAITVNNSELEDQILIKADGYPTYNFANVVDDHFMEITHIVRGSEYLSSVPKYNLLYKAFEWDIPTYVHLPLIMGKKEDGSISKLSKRHGATSFKELVNLGYLPQAIINYIALLGWCPKDNREIFTLDELTDIFTIEGINKSPAIFDYEKLNWINADYIKRMKDDDFYELALPYLQKTIKDKNLPWQKFTTLLKSRINYFSQIPEMIEFFDELPNYENELFINKKNKTSLTNSVIILKKVIEQFESITNWEHDTIYNALKNVTSEMELKIGAIMWVVRIAVTGKTVTPGGAVEILEIFGKEESLKRMKESLKKL